jgi:hypothetical protein
MTPTRLCALVTALACAAALGEQRPPPRGHPLELAAAADAGVPTGRRYLEALPRQAREAVLKDGLVILDQPVASAGSTLVQAVVRFDRPRSEVYALLSHPADQHTFVPHIEVSRPYGERTPQGERDDFEVKVLAFSFKYRTQHWFYPEESRVEWSLDRTGGADLDEQLGFWQLYELDERTTLAEFGTHIRATGPVLDLFRSLGERNTVVEMLTAFRRHVDSAASP